MSIVRLLTDEELTDIAGRRITDPDVDMLLSHIACLSTRRNKETERLRNALGAAVDGLMSSGCASCQWNTARALDIVYSHAPEMAERTTADLKAEADAGKEEGDA